MSKRSASLPSFKNPPISEVSIGLRFEPLQQLRIPHFGSLWQRVKDQYPVVEHATPLVTDLNVIVEISTGAPLPRVWRLCTLLKLGPRCKITQDRPVTAKSPLTSRASLPSALSSSRAVAAECLRTSAQCRPCSAWDDPLVCVWSCRRDYAVAKRKSIPLNSISDTERWLEEMLYFSQDRHLLPDETSKAILAELNRCGLLSPKTHSIQLRCGEDLIRDLEKSLDQIPNH